MCVHAVIHEILLDIKNHHHPVPDAMIYVESLDSIVEYQSEEFQKPQLLPNVWMVVLGNSTSQLVRYILQ